MRFREGIYLLPEGISTVYFPKGFWRQIIFLLQIEPNIRKLEPNSEEISFVFTLMVSLNIL